MLVAGALWSAPAFASPELDVLLRPGQLELKLLAGTGLLWSRVDAALVAELGMIRLGPGTLTLGAEAGGGLCLSLCALRALTTGLSWAGGHSALAGRLSYRLRPWKELQAIEVYGVGLAGPVWVSTSAASADGSVGFHGTDRSWRFGAGGGGSYFIGERLFVGAEAMLSLAHGSYDFTVHSGAPTLSAQDRAWSLSGFGAQFMVGTRF